MRTHWPSIMVAIFYCLFAVATCASADGGWVLWGHAEVVGTNRPDLRIEKWYLLSAFETKPRCDGGWDYAMRERLGKEFSVANGHGKAMWDNFQCFPGTVDPRGPKGSVSNEGPRVSAQGWYLIAPPIIPTSEFTAPRDQWRVVQRFPVAKDCEEYRLYVKTHIDEAVRKTTEQRPDTAVAEGGVKQNLLAAECWDDGNTRALITPPYASAVDTRAPYSQWLNLGSFETATSCEVYRLQVQNLVQNTATTEQLIRVRTMMSQCISVADPRLAPR